MTKPLIPWMGGKRRLAKQLLPLFPEHTCYVEAFAGGAALFFMKSPSKVEVINDVDGDIVNLYRVVKFHMDELVRQFQWDLVARESFLKMLSTPGETLTDIQRAARFFYLQKTSFGARTTSRSFGVAPTAPPRLNLARVGEDISAAYLRLNRTYIEHMDWQKLVARYDRAGTFFYADPPYFETADYGIPFGWEQYEAMADVAAAMQGKLLISLNDHPRIRSLFKSFNIKPLKTTYTVGGSVKAANELAIMNY